MFIDNMNITVTHSAVHNRTRAAILPYTVLDHHVDVMLPLLRLRVTSTPSTTVTIVATVTTNATATTHHAQY